MSITLRNYQNEQIKDIRRLWVAGKKRLAVQLPTGGG